MSLPSAPAEIVVEPAYEAFHTEESNLVAIHNGERVPQTSRRKTRGFGYLNGAAKLIVDVTVALILLLVLSPALLVIALLVRLDGGPALYRHRRVGRDLQPFDCIKFRSMMPDAQDVLEEYLRYNPDDAAVWRRDQKLVLDPRITPIGKILRSTSLDELPQLLNVLRGEMSLVGPRPITTTEIVKYGSTIDFYASVKPGITGLWQVSGRNDVGYDARVALDRCYASIHNVLMDVAILLQTPSAVFSRRGAR